MSNPDPTDVTLPANATADGSSPSTPSSGPVDANHSDEYSAADIQVLEGLEAVRKRPGMYVGGTDTTGLHHLVWETVDNGIDEVMAGRATKCQVSVLADGSIAVTDDGSGIPVEPMTHENPNLDGKPAVEVVMTVLHAGGKFDNSAYKVSGGLHGVGVSCVNALSEWMEVEVQRDGKVHLITFERGEVNKPLHVIATLDPNDNRTGTRVTFKPDHEVFPEIEFDYEVLKRRLRELAYLNSGVEIRLTDERVDKDGKPRDETFKFDDGISAYVAYLAESKTPIAEVMYFSRFDEESGFGVEIAMQYTDAFSETTLTFTNNIFNPSGGTHLTGFKNAVTRTMNAYAKARNLIKGVTPSGDDLREGLVAIISFKHPDPQFNNQPKERLLSVEAESFVGQALGEQFANWLEEHPAISKKICQKGVLAAQAREAARKARDLTRRKSALESGGMPSKLADCTTKDVNKSEIFIVEGDSAGGSAKGGRETEFQAILPLRGKILNVEKARVDKMLAFEEIRTLIQALRCGIGEECDTSQLRYGKVIIMTDADVDGSHIRTLLLTFFFRQMSNMVREGRVFIAQPPLYQIARGKKSHYVLDEKALNSQLTELGLTHSVLIIRDDEGNEIRRLSEAEAKKAVRTIERLEELVGVVHRRGIIFKNLLASRLNDPAGTHRLPSHVVSTRAGDSFFWGEDDAMQHIRTEGLWLDDLHLQDSDSDKQPEVTSTDDAQTPTPNGDVADDSTQSDEDRARTQATVRELHETRELLALIEGANDLGIDINNWDLKQEEDVTGDLLPARYAWISTSTTGKESVSEAPNVPSIKNVLHDVGRSGIEIKRFKGLGEMDPIQLWDTTMDPSRRTLLRVTWDAVSEADNLFSILMGENVENRRNFIEEHALDVKNLDI